MCLVLLYINRVLLHMSTREYQVIPKTCQYSIDKVSTHDNDCHR